MSNFSSVATEICINTDQNLAQSVEAAYISGANRVELCRSMEQDGLSPTPTDLETARKHFRDRVGLLSMIRPHANGFFYSQNDIICMKEQIESAHLANADGIVLGLLNASSSHLDLPSLELLIGYARDFGMKVTFHRAFEALPQKTWLQNLDVLIELGVDRLLFSGVPWSQSGDAVKGLKNIKKLVFHAESRIEIVIGGGVHCGNVKKILHEIPQAYYPHISIHSYSGCQKNGKTTNNSVKNFINCIKAIHPI